MSYSFISSVSPRLDGSSVESPTTLALSLPPNLLCGSLSIEVCEDSVDWQNLVSYLRIWHMHMCRIWDFSMDLVSCEGQLAYCVHPTLIIFPSKHKLTVSKT